MEFYLFYVRLHRSHVVCRPSPIVYFHNLCGCSFYVFICSNRQDRVSIIIGLTIELVSGLINSCKHIGRRSIIMIYCIKYIRINLRALLDLVAAIRFREKFKAIGQTAIKGLFFFLKYISIFDYSVLTFILSSSFYLHFGFSPCNHSPADHEIDKATKSIRCRSS